MKTTNVPKLKNLHILPIRCVLFGVFLFSSLLIFGQDTPIPVDTLFSGLQQRTEAAISELDRPQVKILGGEILELGEKHDREDIRQWGSLYLADGLIREDPKQSKVLLEGALEYFEKEKNTIAIGRCYNLLGSVLSNTNQIREGIELYQKALEYFEAAMPTDNPAGMQRRMTAVLSNIGYAYTRLSLFDRAADYLFDAEKQAREIKDTVILVAIINSLGNVFFLADRIEESHKYFKIAHQLARESGHLPSLRLSYSSLGNTFFMMEELDSALYYVTKSVDLLHAANNVVSLCISLSNQANIYGAMGDCTKADSISHEVLKIAQEKQMARYEALCTGPGTIRYGDRVR